MDMADNNNSQKKLSELQELCQHKDSIIETLAKEVEQQVSPHLLILLIYEVILGQISPSFQRVREEVLVEAKTAKIKEWVASRLKEVPKQQLNYKSPLIEFHFFLLITGVLSL